MARICLNTTFKAKVIMPITSDELHAESLNLLGEVLSYLNRLPLVPATSEFISRIRRHMSDPISDKLIQFEAERSGRVIDPVGRVIVEAVLIGDQLSLRIPSPVPDQIANLDGVLISLRLESTSTER